jgi:hypothetical protein
VAAPAGGDPPQPRRLLRAIAPSSSGAQCASALRQAGFIVQTVEAGSATLVRDDLAIRVPLVETMRPELLLAILNAAKISLAEFLEYLGE